MNIFDIAQTGVTIVLALISWFVPNCQWYIRTIVALVILLLSITISWLRLYAKLRDSNKKVEVLNLEKQGIEARHNALSLQFDNKIEQEQKYRRFITNLNIVLHIALADRDDVKLENVYKFFLLEQTGLSNGGASDGGDYQNREDHQ